MNFVHCLTGWLPEPVPLDKLYTSQLWTLLLKLLPNWKLPQPKPPNDEECRGKKGMVAVNCFCFFKENIIFVAYNLEALR